MSENIPEIDKINPGEELKKLVKLFIKKEISGFIENVDSLFKEEGGFSNVAYESTINYIVRRLIKAAYFFKKKNKEKDGFDNEGYIEDLRGFLSNETRIDSEYLEKVITLLELCTNRFNRTPSKYKVRKLINEARKNNVPCYICGSPYIDLEGKKGEDNRVKKNPKLKVPEVEHIWPRSLGGSNEEFNLKVSCRKCNSHKEAFIDSPDFHYEHIVYDSVADEDQIESKIKFQHKIAIWAKENYKCSICEKSASEVGPLKFRRMNENDHWHYLNIAAFCKEHWKNN